MIENEISGIIVSTGIEIHRALGPGLLEKVYKECLYHQLREQGLYVEKEKHLPIIINGLRIDYACKADLVVEERVVIEVKSTEGIHGLHLAQTLTYLRLGEFKLGLLMNFNVVLMKDGIKRVINGYH